MSKEDQITVHRQLEALQKKDWKTLSVDEKKAGAFFLSFILFFKCSLSLRGFWSVMGLIYVWSDG